MAYRIEGLRREPFEHLFGLSEDELSAHNARRMVADVKPGFPCRIALDDCEIGTPVLLLNHVSHDVPNAYRASHAIFVSEQAGEPAVYEDQVPPALDRRILSLRAFDEAGMMVDAALAQPGAADDAIRTLLAEPRTAFIHAHNAVRGCFAAKIERR